MGIVRLFVHPVSSVIEGQSLGRFFSDIFPIVDFIIWSRGSYPQLMHGFMQLEEHILGWQ
jgi:hypothetical protein